MDLGDTLEDGETSLLFVHEVLGFGDDAGDTEGDESTTGAAEGPTVM